MTSVKSGLIKGMLYILELIINNELRKKPERNSICNYDVEQNKNISSHAGVKMFVFLLVENVV